MTKGKLRKKLTLLAIYAVLITMAILILFPLFVTLMSAFNTSNSLYSTSLIPETFSFIDNFTRLFTETDYIRWYMNTFGISVAAMILATAIITVMGFVYSRYRFKGRKISLTLLLVIQIIPSGSTLIALYAIAQSLGIYSSQNATMYTYMFLTLIYAVGAIPMNTLLMKGYYDSIPRELDESAKIDGATHFQVFKQILIPLVKPMIAVTALFTFLAPIGDVVMPNFLVASASAADKTLALGLNGLISDPTNSSYNLFAAGSILIAIPAILLFYKFQKYIVGGLTDGGVKG